jgi:hypothetical protein
MIYQIFDLKCLDIINRYACLVVEAMANVSDSQKQLVGVVDVTVLRDQTVMDHLPLEAEEYLYVSGIAVLKAFRLLYIYFHPT